VLLTCSYLIAFNRLFVIYFKLCQIIILQGVTKPLHSLYNLRGPPPLENQIFQKNIEVEFLS